MIFSMKIKSTPILDHAFPLSRLEAVKMEYQNWRKKIVDGLKEINAMEIAQIIERYKPFYQVRESKRIFCFIFVRSTRNRIRE